MQSGKRKWAMGGLAVSALAAALAAPPVAAQDASETAQANPEVAPERIIVVTGSRIPRFDQGSVSPIVSISREDLERFGETGVEDVLNEYPQFAPDFGRSSNSPGDGTARLNLRGLGPSRSLVLLNGRRFTPQGTGSAIDLNAIPAVLIDGVEIVTGGASTVYGSDAVTGAINLKTRDFDGIELTGRFDVYGQGDGETYNASLSAGTGFASGQGQVAIYADYLNRSSLLGSDRSFTEFVISENSQTGELEPRGSSIIPEGIIFFPFAPIDGEFTNPVFTPDGSIRAFEDGDLFNFAADNLLQVPLERWSTGILADFDASDDLSIFTELMFAHTRSDRQLAPTPARLGIAFDIDSPFFNDQSRPVLRAAYDPDGDGIANAFFGKRLSEAGPRQLSRRGDYYRALAGMRYRLPADWRLEGYLLYGRVEDRDRTTNEISRSRLLQAVLVDPATGACVDPSNGCVAANLFGEGNLTDEAVEFLRIPTFQNESRSIERIGSVVATGPVFDLPAGGLFASIGAEYRSNSARFDPSPVLLTGDALSTVTTGQTVAGGFNVAEIFAEATLPLLSEMPGAHRLELEGGVRYSDYSRSGGSWTWKAGAQWQPVEGLRFAGAVQRAVRAPNIGELLENPNALPSSLPGTFDFCLASNDPVGRGLADVCVAQGMDRAQIGIYDVPPGVDPARFGIPFLRVRGGNPDLQPELADTLTIGAQYRSQGPIDLLLSVDYFSIELGDAISDQINPFLVCAAIRDPDSEVCAAIRREPSGLLISADDKPLNIASARTDGMDFEARISVDTPAWLRSGEDGRFSVSALATRTFDFAQQSTPDAPTIDCAGLFARECGFSGGTTFPEFVANTVFAYDEARFGAAVRWRFVGPMDNGQPVFDAITGRMRPPLAIPRIGSRNYLDLSVRYDFDDTIRLRAGVDNLLQTSPPLLGSQASQSNTDPARYDIFGRRFFVTFSAKVGG